MKERPILFGGPLVRAILEGRKTQTRRVVRDTDHWSCLTGDCPHDRQSDCNKFMAANCPYGVPGDTLWVRETWRAEELPDGLDGVRYAADGAFVPIANTVEAADAWTEAYANGKHGERWRPSIFMPRWASRLTLLVKSVRVERLQDITNEDARAEGIPCGDEAWHSVDGVAQFRDRFGWYWNGMRHNAPKFAFRAGWDTINGKRAPWASNPWVWAVEFEVKQ